MEIEKRSTLPNYSSSSGNGFPEINSVLDVDQDCNLHEPLRCVDFAAPRLFLVLPSDLSSWNNDNITTHTVRLCFLCDFKCQKEYDRYIRSLTSRSMIERKHMHLSCHPGCDLDRPHEFFFSKAQSLCSDLARDYQDGCTERDCHVPKLDTFEVLGACKNNVTRHLLTHESIGPLVDKSINYICPLQLHAWPTRLRMKGPETRQIR